MKLFPLFLEFDTFENKMRKATGIELCRTNAL